MRPSNLQMVDARSLTLLLAALAVLVVACGGADESEADDSIYRQRMRDLVQDISDYAKGTSPDFLIVPQNGEPLVLRDEDDEGATAIAYLDAIDGIGRETVFCGERRYNKRTPSEDTDETVSFLETALDAGVTVMVTDYCSDRSLVDESYARAAEHGYISFVGSTGNIDLDAIPSYPEGPVHENNLDVASLKDARNFLYLINPDSFETKRRFLEAMRDTNYDIVLIDLFFDGEALSPSEVASLKTKADGGSRLAIAYVNIGAAEAFRYYWQSGWRIGDPAWLADRYEGFEDEAFVQYWDPQWKSLIFGNDESYLKRIMDAGFDGAYLDNVLAYEVFE